MTFPDSKRILYTENPLEEVICQLRFPPILRIDAELPATFQETIRDQYPMFSERSPLDQGGEVPPEIAKMMGLEMQFQVGKQGYNFTTLDGSWTVVLTQGFLALSTKKYERWEQFMERFRTPFEAFVNVYRPAFYSRIGLRYRNVIKRAALNLKEVEWSELLPPYIAGELASPVASAVQKVASNVLIKLHGNIGHVRVRHGLASGKDSPESHYVIDADFFTDERTEVSDATKRLDEYHVEAGRLFRWCITERLHESMGPRPI